MSFVELEGLELESRIDDRETWDLQFLLKQILTNIDTENLNEHAYLSGSVLIILVADDSTSAYSSLYPSLILISELCCE